jgi:hypothetical protein
MVISDRLRELRESKKYVAGGIENKTGSAPLLHLACGKRSHSSSHRDFGEVGESLEVPMHQLFYDGEKPRQLPNLLKRKISGEIVWGSSGKSAPYLTN